MERRRAEPPRRTGLWLVQVLVAVGLSVGALAARRAFEGDAQRAAPPPPPAVAPAALESFALPESYQPVVRYTLEARLDERTHHVHGTGRVRWRNLSEIPQDRLWLHLYLNAFAHADTVFQRHRMPGFRGGHRPATWGGVDVERIYAPGLGVELWERSERHTPGDPDDATDIELSLPEAVAPGGMLELELAWVSRLPSITHRTGFAGSFHMVAQWFPKLARLERDGTWAHFPFHRLSEFYADFGDYDVTLDVPATFGVGATGRVVQEVSDGERKRVRFQAHGVHDFAFTAWDGFDERVAEGPFGVTLRCLYPRGLDDVADLELEEVKAGLALLGKRYGEYPYRTLTVVHPPRAATDAGGMEYPTLITTGGHWLGPWLGVGNLQAVTVHELAHQWFYGVVATNEHRYPFLDEGLTTYASTQVLEDRYPGGSAFSGLSWNLSLWALSSGQAASAWDRGAAARAASDFADGRSYGALVYGKTAVLLETLRRVYGDARLEAALGAYARGFAFKHPTPADLLTAIETHVGPEAADNFRLALLEGEWVDFRAVDLDDDAEATEVRAVRQGKLAFDVDVALHTTDGTVRRVAWPATERWFRAPREGVVAIEIDPDRTVLLDHDLSNNARRLGRSPVAPRVLAQLGFFSQSLAAVLAP